MAESVPSLQAPHLASLLLVNGQKDPDYVLEVPNYP